MEEQELYNKKKQTVIKRLGVRTPSRFQDIVNLPGGNQQNVTLTRWLAEQGIKVFIVDEPTRGIDVGAKSDIAARAFREACSGPRLVANAHVTRNLAVAFAVSRAGHWGRARVGGGALVRRLTGIVFVGLGVRLALQQRH
jgi:ABC-type uncharacterized transport system ATPase subunit